MNASNVNEKEDQKSPGDDYLVLEYVKPNFVGDNQGEGGLKFCEGSEK